MNWAVTLTAQGQSVKPSKNDISSTQVTETNFALFESPATQPNPPFTIDDDSSDDSEKVQDEYVIAKEHEHDKEQNDSFSETTHEMFSDVHSGNMEEGKDQIRQFWVEQSGYQVTTCQLLKKRREMQLWRLLRTTLYRKVFVTIDTASIVCIHWPLELCLSPTWKRVWWRIGSHLIWNMARII